ncbi:MAG TPA: hypothetical protein VH914_21425 [Acidimicrobiia bacterium]|jgi:YD repeat-containing protein|nr:hypothetical protein [Acidimicrobiia bacterium]
MRNFNKTIRLTGLSLLLLSGIAHATAEICGNDIDDDGNGLTDEGCYPSLTTGVCESPLSCGDTGMVAWKTGSLHYDLPPDIAPAVPYGPGIGFRRFYTPMYNPSGAGPVSVNHTPMGPGWQHTYMTWVDVNSSNAILHTSQGRDVLYTYSTTVGTLAYYVPQSGEHVMSFAHDTTSGNTYVQLLTGETLTYNQYGQIWKITDITPAANTVTIVWDGTVAANVSTVTDASGNRQLSFSYTNNLLTAVAFQIKEGGWETVHTTTYSYDNHVTRDATSGWFVPANAIEWGYLLQDTGVPNPSHTWECQETSGSLADSIGSTSLALHNAGGFSYNNSVTGWARKALALTSGSTSYWGNGSVCNPATSDCTAIALVDITALASGEVMNLGDSNGIYAGTTHTVFPTASNSRVTWDASHVATGSYPSIGAAHFWFASSHPTGSSEFAGFESLALTPSYASATSSAVFDIGGALAGADPMDILYASAWSTNLTTPQIATIRGRIESGPGILTNVTISGQLAQQNFYSTSGLLTEIKDGETTPNQIVAFAYNSSGQVVRVSTAEGNLGFEYASTRAVCTGDSILYFNQGGNTNSCSADADCGTGYLCGGQTGAGSTGQCYLAGRCMQLTHVGGTSGANGEDVVTNLSAIGGGGTCTGACLDVQQYVWSSSTGLINVLARQSALAGSDFTSLTYNANGLPTQIGYGDSDGDPTNGGTNRTVYYFYDTTYPGRIAEVRRASDVSSSASSCSATSTTGCERTLYGYGSDNLLKTLEQDGYTLASDGSVTTFADVITYTYDTSGTGRIAEIDGGVAGIKTTFSYYPHTDSTEFRRDFLAYSNVYTDSTHSLEPQILVYDQFGHPTTLKDPAGNLTCDTYDSSRAFLHSRTHAMDNETTCSSLGSDAIATTWTRDSALRLTEIKRPTGECVDYTYDAIGQPSKIIRTDGCNEDGDYIQFTVQDGLTVLSQRYLYFGTAPSVSTSVSATYYDSRQQHEVIDPGSPNPHTDFDYDAAGRLTEVDSAGGLGKTIYNYDGSAGRDGRVTSEERYRDASNYDTWELLYSWEGDQSQYEDGDSKTVGSLRDDAGRFVRLVSPDQANPTVFVYDTANRLTTKVEDLGGGSAQTHNFTYDYMSRRLNDDYAGACATAGTAHPEIQRTYDALPSGVTCPNTGGCTNLAGRLAVVEVTLACSSTYSATDGALDQFTYFSYDASGRVTDEYIKDDSGRYAEQAYVYDKDGHMTIMYPLEGSFTWNYGGTGDSDDDLLSSIQYSFDGIDGHATTTGVEDIQYYPFGGLESYTQENTVSSNKIKTVITRGSDDQISDVKQSYSTTATFETAISRDAKKRVTSRVYTGAATGVTNSYFLYDEQDRVICETSAFYGTCPGSGSSGLSAVKNNHDLTTPFAPFTAAGDWKHLLRPIAGSSGMVNDFNASGSTYGSGHQVTSVNQSDGVVRSTGHRNTTTSDSWPKKVVTHAGSQTRIVPNREG